MSDDLGRMLSIGSVSLGIFDGPHATPKKTNNGPVFLGIETLSQGRIDLSRIEHLSEEDFVRWTRRVVPQRDDLVFSYETRLGQAALIPAGLRCCLGRRMALVRPDQSKIIPRFLLYYFIGPEFQEVIRQRTIQGSTVDRILLREFPDFPVRVPSLSVQEEIAGVLGCLDDKIDLNHRMNQTLKAIARAIFKSWFVDFEPVRKEGVEFARDFKESPQGLIPEDWSVEKLGACCQLAYGKAMKAEARSLGRVPVMGSNGQIGWHGDALVAGPGIVVGRKGNPGTVHWVSDDFFPIDTTFYVVPLRPEISMYYLYYALSESNLHALSSDSAVPGLNRNIAYLSDVLIPSSEAMQFFESCVSLLHQKIDANVEESRTLATLRDTLLPKLLSGEIRVKQAEKLVGEAV